MAKAPGVPARFWGAAGGGVVLQGFWNFGFLEAQGGLARRPRAKKASIYLSGQEQPRRRLSCKVTAAPHKSTPVE